MSDMTELMRQCVDLANMAIDRGETIITFPSNAHATQWARNYRSVSYRARKQGRVDVYDILQNTGTKVPTKSSMVIIFRKIQLANPPTQENKLPVSEVNTKATKSKHQMPESLKGGAFGPNKPKNIINPFKKGKKDDRMNPHGMPRKQKPGIPDWEQIHNWMSDHEGWHDGPTIGKYSGVGHGYEKALKELLMASMVEANWKGKAPLYKAKVVI